MNLLARAARFYAVGGVGILVQLAALALFHGALGWHYLVATAAAVEVALLHNFLWHEWWTWRDRTRSAGGALARLARFNLTTGAVSLFGNLVFMRLLAGHFRMPYLAANVASIAACALLNFVAGEWLVFRPPRDSPISGEKTNGSP